MSQVQAVAASSGLTLELTSGRSGSKDEIGAVRRHELSDGSTRLTVTLPCMIDGEQANLTAALLFEQIDRLPYRTHVERVKLHGLQFTTEGVTGIKGFLSAHAATIKHVSLKDIMTGDYNSEDAEAFASLARVFQSSKLETLNLSDNTISASLWRNWASHTHLRQLILDYVHIDDESLQEMQMNFTFADSLEELYVVLTNHVGKRGLHAANKIVRSCRKVSSLRWAVKDAPPDATLPWFGLAELAHDMNTSRNGSCLHHLVMDGGTLTTDESGPKGLCGALKHFTQLKTLKLRSVGLTDHSLQSVAAALFDAKPPLENLDLSRNQIQTPGAMVLTKIADIDNITSNLTVLTLDRNTIDEVGAKALLETFGSKSHQKIDIKLDGNPFHYGKVAAHLAWRLGQVAQQRDETKIKELGASRGDGMTAASDHTSVVSELRFLQDEVVKLRAEKATLIQAFSVMGAMNQVDDQTRLMDRVAELEQSVFGAHKQTTLQRASSRGDDESSQRSGSRMSSGNSSGRRESYSSYQCESPGRSVATNRRYSTASTATRKSSPESNSTAASSNSRRVTRDLGASQNVTNVLARDTSERWNGATPTGVKSKPPSMQAPSGSHIYSSPNKSRGKISLDDDKGHHSRTHSDRFQVHGSAALDYNQSISLLDS